MGAMTPDEARRLLGVGPDASPEAIRKTYKQHALKCHPDKNPDDPAGATQRFQRVAEAYKCLTDPNYSDEDELSEEELRKEMDAMMDDMVLEFERMCRAAGIPAPPPALARAMMFGGMMDDLGAAYDEDGDDDLSEGEKDLARKMRDAFRQQQSDVDDETGFSPSVAASHLLDDDDTLAEVLAAMTTREADDVLRALELDDHPKGLTPLNPEDDDDDAWEDDDDDDDDVRAVLAARARRRRSKPPGGAKAFGGGGPVRTGLATNHKLSSQHRRQRGEREREQPPPPQNNGKSHSFTTTTLKNLAEVALNARVDVRGEEGVVRFVGEVHYAKGEFVGVALDAPLGKNDGTVKGTTYFTCAPKHGLMVRRADVRVLSPPPLE